MLNYVPERKMASILDTGRWLLSQKKAQVRSLASFYGKVASCNLALGPCASLLSREGHSVISVGSDISWNFYIALSDEIKEEVRTLIALLPELNGFPIHQTVSLTPSMAIATDASATGLAGMEVKCGGRSSHVDTCKESCSSALILHRRFDEFELKQSSTYRELVALWELYFRRADRFAAKAILHMTDNANVPLILKKGSKVALLQEMALDIFKACHKYKVLLYAQWVPRTNSHLLLPDYFSREHDISDWGLENSALHWLLAQLPFKLEVDLFASQHNHRIPIFFSRNACPDTSAVNALTQDWRQWGPGLCVPPPDMITATISHIIACKSKGLMIIPLWRAADFWMAVAPDGRHVNSIFFDGFKQQLPMVSAPHLNRLFSGITSFPMLYLLYDGSCTAPNVSFKERARCIFDGCELCQP
jgi:hypothetical protein